MKNHLSDIYLRVFDGKEENLAAAQPLALATKNLAQIKGRILVRQAVGKLVQPNVAFHEQMTNLGIAHDYDQFDGVGHNVAAIYEKLGDKNWVFYRRAFAPAPAASDAAPK